uniref:Uncharacterized protein n=1 Tax=Lygus hesperus TaxID=30085 RepID=A0A146LXY4_LYGHE
MRMCHGSEKKMFEGFISRWIIPRLWMWSYPATICENSDTTSTSCTMRPGILYQSCNVPYWQYCICMYYTSTRSSVDTFTTGFVSPSPVLVVLVAGVPCMCVDSGSGEKITRVLSSHVPLSCVLYAVLLPLVLVLLSPSLSCAVSTAVGAPALVL